MTHEDARRYYDAIVEGLPDSIFEDLKTDLRLRHILIHHSGVVPEGVDEDDFFEEILGSLGA